MTDADAKWQQLRAAFSAELEERTRSLNQLLLHLEGVGGAPATSAGATFDALFREAHSIKGAARMVAMPQMEQLAHALETALQAARDHPGPLPAEWFDAAYGAVDTFAELQRRALEGIGEAPPEFDALFARLRAPLASAATDVQAAPVPAPAVQPPPAEPPQPSEPLPSPEPVANGHAARRNGTTRANTSSPAPAEPPAAAAPLNGVPAPGEETTGDGRAVRRDGGVRTERASGESVRVAVGKLDALLAQAGELAVAQIRLDQTLRELQEVQRDVQAWRRSRRSARSLRTTLSRGHHAHPGQDTLDVSEARSIDALLVFLDETDQRAGQIDAGIDQAVARLRVDAAQLGQVTRAIEDEVMAVRLIPAASIFAPFQRMVRDLGRQHQKDVRLLIEGGETEIDRKILEQLRDPLMHLLRNAIDHGVEPPQQRVAAGKPATATIRLAAVQRGGQIEIEVADDGAGINPVRLRERAVARGLLTREQAASLDDAAATELIFRRGFSTSETVTETSGRGVGMDVVREHVERLGGTVRVESVPGAGTRFLLSVPLTLATTRAVVIEHGGQFCAIPSAAIARMGRLRAADELRLEGRRAVQFEGKAIPLVELSTVLEQPAATNGARAGTIRPYVVLQQGERRLALLADRLVDEQEIVIKSLAWPLRRVRNVGGAAVLGSGQTAVILNPSDLLKSGLKLAGRATALDSLSADMSSPEGDGGAVAQKRLLVVDDSLTTRTLERSILEAAGYDVAVAVDGADALRILRQQPIDLIVSDVQMPNLDGFALTAEIRRDPQLRSVPVVLVTSLDAPEHRERGAAAGADAYIVKSAFDQGQLLETIGRLL